MSGQEFAEKAKQQGKKVSKFFNDLFSPGQGQFKGQGHRLGEGYAASSSQAQPQNRPQQPPSRPPARNNPFPGQPKSTKPPVRQALTPQQQQEQRERQLAAAEARQKQAALPAKLRHGSQPSQPPPQPAQASPPEPVPASLVERLDGLVSQAKAAGFEESHAKVLGQILVNLKENPQVEKFRKFRAGNTKINEAVVQFEALVSLLGQVGFQAKYLPKVAGSEEQEKYFVFPAQAPLLPVEQALGAIIHHFPIVDSLLPTSPPPEQVSVQNQAAPRERNTKVVVPQPGGNDSVLSDDFFRRTHQELRREYLAAQKAKEQQEVLMTRAQREKLQQQQRNTGSRNFAILKVRFPEGVDLQGDFNPSEPLTRVFEWVGSALHNPALEFDLALPGQGPLGREGTVGMAGLVPGAALTLLVRGEHDDDMCLSAEWVSKATMEA